MAYTRQFWLEELREEKRVVSDDLRKKMDLRNLFIVKVETVRSLSQIMESDILNEYEKELASLNAEVKELQKKNYDLNTLIDKLESLGKSELKRTIN